MINTFKIKIKEKLWSYLKDYFFEERMKDSNIIQNINFLHQNNQKRLLICYLTEGYFVNLENELKGTIPFEIFKMVKIYSEAGYCIDIIDCNDTSTLKIISRKKYDVIFGFGETFIKMTELNKSAISILYMTENHPDFSFQEEKKRLDYFYFRHKRYAKMQRSGKYYKSSHFDNIYSNVITLSETEPLMKQYKSPYTILPTGKINPDFIYKNKNHTLARKNFLWLGSQGAIHKGLDLLIDVFKNENEIILHICGLNTQEKKILKIPQKPNIIDYGFIDIKSNTFLQLVETCSYITLPSCSEAFSTSITTGMLHGLIPIVVKDTGFNRLNLNAIFLNNVKIDYLNKKFIEFSNSNANDLEIFSKNVFEFAHKNFTISKFEENFRSIIKDILKEEDGGTESKRI